MATLTTTTEDRPSRRTQAVAIAHGQAVQQQTSRMHAMILLAIVMFGSALASHAFAAEGMGGGMDAGGAGHGLGVGGHMGAFHAPMIDQAPSMPAPTFNPSEPYSLPQSPENSVSPASPGSIFGNG